MGKLAIIFVAVFVAVAAAAPNSLLAKLQSFEHMKRAANLLIPLGAVEEQKKGIGRVQLQTVMNMLDTDNDGMLNKTELKKLLSLGGTPTDELESTATIGMEYFDHDKNNKLDINEMEAVLRIAGM